MGRLFGIAATVSLLLAIVTAGFWAASYRCKWARIDVARRQIIVDVDAEGRPTLAEERYRGLLFENGRIVAYRFSLGTELGPTTGWDLNDCVLGRNLGTPSQWVWAAAEPDPFGNPLAYQEFGVRAALVVSLAAVVPAIWLARRWGRRRHIAGRHPCAGCGYDLRATPERCPECGQVRASRTPAAT